MFSSIFLYSLVFFPYSPVFSCIPLYKLVFTSILFYDIDTSVKLEYTPLVKIIRNYIRETSGLFSISSLVKISLISLISSLFLKLYSNSLVYDRNIFVSSSKAFGNLRKLFGNVRLAFGTILENLWKVVGNLRKSSKTPSSVRIFNT